MTSAKRPRALSKPTPKRRRSHGVAPSKHEAPAKVAAGTIASTIRRLLQARGPGKSICPSDVARALAPTTFRALMPDVRAEAARMARTNEIVATQRGVPVDAERARGPIRLARAVAPQTSYADAYRGIDFRKEPEKYRIGRGEEGVLLAEPYKSELLPLWRFRTAAIAKTSSAALWQAFLGYRRSREFIGMDMVRKYLQMGFTRARRYANHRSGKKYGEAHAGAPRGARRPLPRDEDPEKAAAAKVFYEAWQRLERDPVYAAWRKSQRTGAGGAAKKGA